jgi:hypothetical protein
MKTLIVLGMHRSATSLVAKGLCEAGVCMGQNLLGPGPGNPHGHFEDVQLIKLNDKILSLAGGSWKAPPDEHDIISVGIQLEEEIKNIIKSHEASLWGWKDPRTTLTIRCYEPFLTNPIYISCFREPEEVAKSLYARDKMPINEGVALANTYNRRLLDFLIRKKYVMIY